LGFFLNHLREKLGLFLGSLCSLASDKESAPLMKACMNFVSRDTLLNPPYMYLCYTSRNIFLGGSTMIIAKRFLWLVVLGLLLASCSTAPSPEATRAPSATSPVLMVETEAAELSAQAADPFNITVKFVGNPPAFFKTAVLKAAKRWERVVSKGLIGGGSSIINSADYDSYTCPSFRGKIDDIVVFVNTADQGGSGGILSSTRACLGQFIQGLPAPRSVTAVPLISAITFDAADVQGLGTAGLETRATQEMGRALGLGIFWDFNSLILNSGTSKPTYYGANAVKAYKALGGAGNIPLETRFSIPLGNGAPLSIERETYWSEKLGNELLTPVLTAGKNPLSRITLGALIDLGYSVNTAASDAYTLPR
jgi:hypothetical protein